MVAQPLAQGELQEVGGGVVGANEVAAPLDESAGTGSAVLGVRSEPGSGDALTEMIAVLDAQRAYEQNASIFDTAKRLAERTIDVGRA